MSTETVSADFAFFDLKPRLPDMREEVLQGLERTPKEISPKYFYDELGSELFNSITQLPEYYLTRTETKLLQAKRQEIAETLGDEACLIEYGSGSGLKSRILIDAVQPTAYVPVDISTEQLMESAQTIHVDYPGMAVFPICADYSLPFDIPTEINGANRTVFFPGSSIGNFSPDSAQEFLVGVGEVVGAGGTMVLGVDTRKSPEVLERAYNDSAGLTAAFNLNILSHLNNQLGANFRPDFFDHSAVYDEEDGCIRMYLVSNRDHTVNLDDTSIEFRQGESIHTENSFKYSRSSLEQLVDRASFDLEAIWSDRESMFMIAVLRKRG